ncbi:MAG: RNA 2',3'-cyclic phosphodiesterase [Planctomycetota bacterium]
MPRQTNHFLALRLDDDSRDRLATVADRLRAWDLPARWTHPDDYHVTLVFLGPIDDSDASYLPAAIDELAGSFRRPALTFAGLGASGGSTEPKYVFAATSDSEAACAGMRADLCEVLEMKPEARYQPHVTICRPQSTPANLPLFRDWPHLLEANGIAHWGACTTSDVVLWRRSDGGVRRYDELARWPLIA